MKFKKGDRVVNSMGKTGVVYRADKKDHDNALHIKWDDDRYGKFTLEGKLYMIDEEPELHPLTKLHKALK